MRQNRSLKTNLYFEGLSYRLKEMTNAGNRRQNKNEWGSYWGGGERDLGHLSQSARHRVQFPEKLLQFKEYENTSPDSAKYSRWMPAALVRNIDAGLEFRG
jgi:hypothetical protein